MKLERITMKDLWALSHRRWSAATTETPGKLGQFLLYMVPLNQIWQTIHNCHRWSSLLCMKANVLITY